MGCLKCGGTGILLSGERCDCDVNDNLQLPTSMKVPAQYQDIQFDERLVPGHLDISYGRYMSKLLRECTDKCIPFRRNVLICAPPNSGKTVLAYTVYSILYGRGIAVPELMDIMELRNIMMNPYAEQEKFEEFSEAQVAFIKIPQDLPNKLAETMSTIVERRVRRSKGTVFLFSGSKEDLIAQDRFGKLRALFGDGAFNSIEVRSWTSNQKWAVEVEDEKV